MKWIYTINKGLSYSNDSNIELRFGMARDLVRKMLSYKSETNSGRFASEDSYLNLFDIPEHWIRLGFENDKLFDIEVLNGIVIFDDIEIQTRADLKDILDRLKAIGHVFQETDYSFTNRISKIDLGDSEKNGGISNLIYWILVAENFDYMD